MENGGAGRKSEEVKEEEEEEEEEEQGRQKSSGSVHRVLVASKRLYRSIVAVGLLVGLSVGL